MYINMWPRPCLLSCICPFTLIYPITVPVDRNEKRKFDEEIKFFRIQGFHMKFFNHGQTLLNGVDIKVVDSVNKEWSDNV